MPPNILESLKFGQTHSDKFGQSAGSVFFLFFFCLSKHFYLMKYHNPYFRKENAGHVLKDLSTMKIFRQHDLALDFRLLHSAGSVCTCLNCHTGKTSGHFAESEELAQ